MWLAVRGTCKMDSRVMDVNRLWGGGGNPHQCGHTHSLSFLVACLKIISEQAVRSESENGGGMRERKREGKGRGEEAVSIPFSL